MSREEARKRKKKWKEKRGERRTEFGRVSCNESLSLENALAFLLLDEPKMRERGTEMARARKRKKGRGDKVVPLADFLKPPTRNTHSGEPRNEGKGGLIMCPVEARAPF